MNQELRQRLIGAVVVTALAAIFIPMLFDDPVDDSGQLVSELIIPEEPAVSVEEPEKKLPGSVADVSASHESMDMPMEDIKSDEGTDASVLSTDELEAEAPSEEEQEQALERPVDNKISGLESGTRAPSLDTGIVEEEPGVAAKPVEKQLLRKPVVLKTDTLASAKIANKTVKPVVANHPVEVMSVEKLAKPVKPNPQASRWYIQAGSFSKKENALALAENLRKQGMPVLLETIQVGGKGTFYRLKVGPELDKKRAAAMKSKLDQQNIKTMLVAE
ncbi:MAG: SPOR domain-containing protein [Methylovulum sp.]|nr:SPOR domain-containing protein [Methylovulum sp.]